MRARPCAASRTTSRATASESPVAGGCVRPDQDRDTRLSAIQVRVVQTLKSLFAPVTCLAPAFAPGPPSAPIRFVYGQVWFATPT